MTGGVHPCRRQASSDRDAVWCSEPTSKRQHRRPASRWGPRRLSGDYEAQLSITAPPPSGDPHSQIHGELHHQCRRRARSLPCESSQLKAQRRAAHRLPAGAASRAAWKAVSRACKQELRGCNIIFTEPAKWTGEPRERSTTAKHGKDGSTTFSTTYTGNAVCTSISATSSTKHRWSARKPVCKQRAPPLRGRASSAHGGPSPNKSLSWPPLPGNGGIPLGPMESRSRQHWESRIRYMLDHFPYRGTLPPPVLAGITVLLPKTTGPPPPGVGGHTSHHALFDHP